MTREYTLPALVYTNQVAVIEEIAEASKLTVGVMITEGGAAAAILAYLFMRPVDERTRGLNFFMRMVGTTGTVVTISAILHSVMVPLMYTLALELGDDDKIVQAQVRGPSSQRSLRS